MSSGIYEVPAFIRVYADSPEDAKDQAEEFCEDASLSPDVTLGVEPSPPVALVEPDVDETQDGDRS